MIDCFFGELIPRCPAGDCAGWIILGTVEITNGCLVRVCNCPRSYVWSFVNLPQVLLTTILANRACTDATQNGQQEICCADIQDEDCGWLLELLAANSSALGLAATEPLARIAELRESARAAFDLTQPGLFSPRIVRGKQTKDAQEILSRLGITNVELRPEARAPRGRFPIEAIEALGLISQEHGVTLTGEDMVEYASIFADRAMGLSPGDQQTLDRTRREAARARELASNASDEIKGLQKRLYTLEKKLAAEKPGGRPRKSPPAK